jgi:hypothetical protein
MRHKRIHSSLLIWLLSGAIIILVSLTTVWSDEGENISKNKPNLQTLAQNILESCSKKSYKPGCYDTEIPKLMSAISMEDAFKVTQLVQREDMTYGYCHVLGHNLSAKEVNKDPSKWKDVIARCPSGSCSNGCLHGGFQERFRAESFTTEQVQTIIPELESICEDTDSWHPTGLEQASCYHAIGHLVMYITNADTKLSTKLCDRLAKKSDGRDFDKVCSDGVFMQLFQPLEPEDFALIKGKAPEKENVQKFCGDYTGQKKASCLSETWPLFREEILSSPKGVANFCGMQGKEYIQACLSNIYFITPIQLSFDDNKIISYCSSQPKEFQPYCFYSAASRYIETDYNYIPRAINFCDSSGSEGNKDFCFQHIVDEATFNFNPSSEEYKKFCTSLSPTWEKVCISRK